MISSWMGLRGNKGEDVQQRHARSFVYEATFKFLQASAFDGSHLHPKKAFLSKAELVYFP